MGQPRSYTRWTIGPTLAEYLESLLSPNMRTLEFGSGLSTHIFLEAGCNHVALEHDPTHAMPHPCIILSELVGQPPIYARIPSGPFDLILIDGPPASCGGRWGVLRILPQLMSDQTVVILDDAHRKQEAELAMAIRRAWGMTSRRLHPHHPQDFARSADVLMPITREEPMPRSGD